jgi:hypothetical protein
MARGAATRSAEIATPRSGISGCQVRGDDGAAPAAKRFGLGLLVVDETGDRGQIHIAQAKGWHTLFRASTANQRSDPITTMVFGDEF